MRKRIAHLLVTAQDRNKSAGTTELSESFQTVLELYRLRVPAVLAVLHLQELQIECTPGL